CSFIVLCWSFALGVFWVLHAYVLYPQIDRAAVLPLFLFLFSPCSLFFLTPLLPVFPAQSSLLFQSEKMEPAKKGAGKCPFSVIKIRADVVSQIESWRTVMRSYL
ncbi:unnamed protein product, partial [Urochloa humidicola]